MKLRVALFGACVFVSPWVAAQSAAGGDWPCFRHDPQLTGRSPLIGHFSEAPREVWRVDLDAPDEPVEKLRSADLDGDGVPEMLAVRRNSIAALGRDGKTLWEAVDLPRVQVNDVRDFAGGGPRGILATTSNGLESGTWMISGATGNSTRLYAMRDVFGAEERVGKILPDVRGEQICAWWSGDNADQPFGGATMYGEGYLYSFENGVDAPVARFEQQIEGALYKPRHFFADCDQDGEMEMVTIGSHFPATVVSIRRYGTGPKPLEA